MIIEVIFGGIDLHIEEIAQGGAVEIEVIDDGKTLHFSSNVVQVKSNTVLIASIIVNDQTIGFSDNLQIKFLYKEDGRVYLWENAVVKLVKFNHEIYHMVELLGEGKPYNRREAYRQYIGEEMLLYINTSQGPTALTALVKDISEGGVSFITQEDYEVGRTIRLKLKDNSSMISLSGIIVRKEPLTHLNSLLYGCKFNEKNQKLANYIAKKQGEELKKRI